MRKLETAKGILFDLDNTLYPRERGVFDRINEKINEYVRLTTGREGQDVDILRREYLQRYGTTLGGLMRHEDVDVDEYLHYVHDVPVEDMLEPDAALISFLGSIELPMVIFTNGTRRHAGRVLDAMGVSPFFDGICDLEATAYLGKPHRGAFEAAVGLLDCRLKETIFIDDLPVNVEAGAAIGTLSIHVNGHTDGVGDMHVKSVMDLEPVFSQMPWYRGKC
jgi:putative hydrolase of the HAD superfamily